MTRASGPERGVFSQFVDAVLALSDDPRPANLDRYLAASRAVEEARAAARPQRRDRRHERRTNDE
jgi:hypothetical protein